MAQKARTQKTRAQKQHRKELKRFAASRSEAEWKEINRAPVFCLEECAFCPEELL
jgi:hypothetical protein